VYGLDRSTYSLEYRTDRSTSSLADNVYGRCRHERWLFGNDMVISTSLFAPARHPWLVHASWYLRITPRPAHTSRHDGKHTLCCLSFSANASYQLSGQHTQHCGTAQRPLDCAQASAPSTLHPPGTAAAALQQWVSRTTSTSTHPASTRARTAKPTCPTAMTYSAESVCLAGARLSDAY
jgi:hypothetical protein